MASVSMLAEENLVLKPLSAPSSHAHQDSDG